MAELPIPLAPEALFETNSGSGLGETPLKALLTVKPQLEWFIFISTFFQWTADNPAFFFQSIWTSIPIVYPDPTSSSMTPHEIFAFPLGQPSTEQQPYVAYFECTPGQEQLSGPTDLATLVENGIGYNDYLQPVVVWMYSTIDQVYPDAWFLNNALGTGYFVVNPQTPVTAPPYTYFNQNETPSATVSGFCVFPSPNYKIPGYSYPPGEFGGTLFDGPPPDIGTTICLNKGGTTGCIALHPYDATRANLSPADPHNIQQVTIAKDGPLYFNGPPSSVPTGTALVYWIGLTPAQVPNTATWPPPPAPQTFTPQSKNLLIVQ